MLLQGILGVRRIEYVHDSLHRPFDLESEASQRLHSEASCEESGHLCKLGRALG